MIGWWISEQQEEQEMRRQAFIRTTWLGRALAGALMLVAVMVPLVGHGVRAQDTAPALEIVSPAPSAQITTVVAKISVPARTTKALARS